MKQKEALEILKMGYNVFLTGAAGSGKTYLLNTYIEFLRENNVEVGITASTGIAATHIDGITIHSWSGIGIKDFLDDWDLDSLLQKQYLAKRIQNTKVLIIDEVSMLDDKRLDLVDLVCRSFRQNDLPFGGMQVILSGDFFQLPPINKKSSDFGFINKSKVWNEMNLKVCYLEEQHRHECGTLNELLNNIRSGNIGEDVLLPLRACYKREIKNITPTKLYTHNADIDEINRRELNKIEGFSKTYQMSQKGNKKLVDTLKKSCLAQEELELKKGAVVMFIKNNLTKRYVNGTLGKVVDFENGFPVVSTYDGREIIVDREPWTVEEDGKIKAEIMQIPLRLAWAITIHKSQGMSLDSAEVDLSKSFVEGMGYVALSRVKSLKGLRLVGLNKIALEINKEVSELDKDLSWASNKSVDYLNQINDREKQSLRERFLISIAGTKIKKEPKISTYEITKEMLENKLSLEEIAEERQLTRDTIIGHVEKLQQDGFKIDIDYLKKSLDKNRLSKILKAFEKNSDNKLTPVKKILGDDFDFDEIRMARLFIEKY